MKLSDHVEKTTGTNPVKEKTLEERIRRIEFTLEKIVEILEKNGLDNYDE